MYTNNGEALIRRNVNIRQVFFRVKMTDSTHSDFDSVPPVANSTTDTSRLAAIFLNFNPLNTPVENSNIWSTAGKDSISASDAQVLSLSSYIRDSRYFNRRVLLTTRRYDHIVYAIFTQLLHWSMDSVNRLILLCSEVKTLYKLINKDLMRLNFKIYEYRGIPFLRSTFKILISYFDSPEANNNNAKLSLLPGFSLNSYYCEVDSWIREFNFMAEKLIKHRTSGERKYGLTQTDINAIEQRRIETITTTMPLKFSCSGRYITGQACCGKTTLLRKFETLGWQVYNRSSLGTFSAKSRNAAEIAALHAALDVALSQPDVIGDRGPIDNPLWSAIMSTLRTKHENFLHELQKFFAYTLNELVISYHRSFKCLIILDPNPVKNAERQLARDTGSDALRARIKFYGIVQFLAYYMAAKYFDWPIRCLPYNEMNRDDDDDDVCEKEKVNWSAYTTHITNFAIDHFDGHNVKSISSTNESNEETKNYKISRVADLYHPDMTYAIDTDIFK